VAYLLKARIVEREKQPLLANGSETTFVFGNHVLAETDTHATIDICLKRCFLLGPCKMVIRNTIGATESVLYGRKEAAGRKPPFRDDLNT
jgi:hypothetical protein